MSTFLKRSVIVFLLGAFASPFAFAQVAPDCALLSRNLRLGMSGNDVLVLQRLLNDDAATRLADSGAGSPGFETTYFGERTRGAVSRFQELYAQEVLFPVGLTRGSGFFGVYSRAKLAALCEKDRATPAVSAIPTAVSGTATIPAIPAIPVAAGTSTKSATSPVNMSVPVMNPFLVGDNDYFHVKYPSSYVVSPGDKVTIYGGGFTEENNTLWIGTQSFSGLKPTLLGTLEVALPAGISLGKFELWVENTKGASNKSFIIITAPGTVAPVITSFTPTVTQIGKTITVTGSGFTGENNEVRLSVSTIRGVASSDGKTLSFVFAVSIPGVTPELIPPGTTRGISFPVSFYVVNANGISNRATFIVAY